MAKEPGNLNDLVGQAQVEWDGYINSEIRKAIEKSGTQQLVFDNSISNDVLPIDWSGYPIRIRQCLESDLKTDKLLDWVLKGNPLGRTIGSHEEYLEWRVLRNRENKIVRIEMTTESREYWKVLAKHHPTKTLRILGRFAGEFEANPQEVYGLRNIFNSSPQEREDGFIKMMFLNSSTNEPLSPYNNGEKAIAFMAKPVNTISAAIQLAAWAAKPYVKMIDGQRIPLTGREAINFTDQAAQDCRDSDPTIVGTVINLASSKRKISLNDPVGLYISNVNHKRLLLPDQSDSIPADWIDLQRGSRPTMEGGQEMSQRLVMEVPSEMGFVLGDIIDADTGRSIEYGGQIAKLVTIALYGRATSENSVNINDIISNPGNVPPCSKPSSCSGILDLYKKYESITGQSLIDSKEELVTRGNGDLI